MQIAKLRCAFINFKAGNDDCMYGFPLASAPSGPPQNVTVTAVSSTSIHVSWMEVNQRDQNGIVTNYVIQYFNLRHSSTANITTASMVVTLSGLHEFEDYAVQVAAQTVAGLGPFSEPRTVLTHPAGTSAALLHCTYCNKICNQICMTLLYICVLNPFWDRSNTVTCTWKGSTA